MYGRYIKDKRGLPQKEESCKDCKGKGCIFCNNHGWERLEPVASLFWMIILVHQKK
uniref:Putative pseudouridylate synthase n=1 Tax=uncultured marine thaumarchaeote KM3_39_A11 TaxID=1456140 RepID=A0A075H572_9ARCH|nr:putative pseudouridylate synthase [uncultured marine thaumarchaeote KM3_39_A11]